jgi:hypothetical protein
VAIGVLVLLLAGLLAKRTGTRHGTSAQEPAGADGRQRKSAA